MVLRFPHRHMPVTDVLSSWEGVGMVKAYGRCNTLYLCLQGKEVGVLREDQVKFHQMKNEFEKLRGVQEEAKVRNSHVKQRTTTCVASTHY